jgi:hypothetical protein
VSLSARDEAGGSGVRSITFSATGAQPIIRTTVSGSTASVPITAEGITTLSYLATDQAGNQAQPQTVTVKIDETTPLVSFTGNQGSYTVEQMVNIMCTASDPRAANGAAGSGIASSTCPTVSAPAYTFNLGPTTLTATATDVAGNPSGGATTFNVRVTYASLCTLSRRFVSNQALSDGMCTVLDAAQQNEQAGVPQGKAAELRAYQQLVETAQQLGAPSVEHARVLSRLADAL